MGLADTFHIGPFARPGGTDRFLERPIQLTLASACVSALLQYTCYCSGAALAAAATFNVSWPFQRTKHNSSLMVAARHFSVSVVMAEGRGRREKVGVCSARPEDQQHTVLAREYRSCLFS